MKKIILITLIITFIMSAVFGISVVLFELYNEVVMKVLSSTFTLFAYSIPGLACSANYEKSKDKYFSIIGIITCFIGVLYFLQLIWGISFSVNEEIIFTLIILPISFGHISLLLLVDSKDNKVNYFKMGTIFISVLIDIILLYVIYFKVVPNYKLLTILFILGVVGTIVTPLLNRLSDRIVTNDSSYDKLMELKKLLDNNLITNEEFELEKKKILNNK